ncbi:hypothetical protein IMSHALPRED_010118 [Imshaugia aleurites]|uniref:Uncharacterized protein n=1 Tax=Imshaugia aleurites TaxID=172621 RepID=A0A8H3G3H7_9LECA|nr:hypothetical protein IMSHALPRED_010118 [Imshaugia aleurites]
METANLALPTNNNNNESPTRPLLPSHALQPRQLPPHAHFTEPSLILIVSFAVVGLATVTCLACIALARLFRSILDTAITLWARSPPSNQVVLEAGAFRIEFGCSVQPVPLEFVEDFAKSYLDAVERGFAPLFAREWWWERREGEGQGEGRVCYAGFRVVVEGGVVIPPFG